MHRTNISETEYSAYYENRNICLLDRFIKTMLQQILMESKNQA